MYEKWVWSLGWGEGIANHSSVLVWKIPRTEKPGGLPSIGLQRIGHDWSDLVRVGQKKKKKFKEDVFLLVKKNCMRIPLNKPIYFFEVKCLDKPTWSKWASECLLAKASEDKTTRCEKGVVDSFEKRGQGRHRTDEMLGQGCAVLDKSPSLKFLRIIKYYTWDFDGTAF